jgi:hypothetical protein
VHAHTLVVKFGQNDGSSSIFGRVWSRG